MVTWGILGSYSFFLDVTLVYMRYTHEQMTVCFSLVNLSIITEDVSQELRRIEGKLFFLLHTGLLFHMDCRVGKRENGAKQMLVSGLSESFSQESIRLSPHTVSLE